MFDGGNIENFPLVATQDFELKHLIEAVKIKSRGKAGESFDAAIIGSENDILNLQASSRGGAVGLDIGDDHSPALCEVKALGQRGRDLLGNGSDLDAVNVPVLAQALINEIDD